MEEWGQPQLPQAAGRLRHPERPGVFEQAKADAGTLAETVEIGGERAHEMETVKDAELN